MKRQIPARWITVSSDKPTVATHGKGGLFTGRKMVRTKGDTTRVRHIKSGVDIDHDGDSDGGQIYGRTVKVKASGRARGYNRRV